MCKTPSHRSLLHVGGGQANKKHTTNSTKLNPPWWSKIAAWEGFGRELG